MRIYTRKGDGGQTGIWGGRRIGKDDLRAEAMGTVDECSAAVGLASAEGVPDVIGRMATEVQRALFVVGCDLAAPETTGSGASVPRLSPSDTAAAESMIDELESELPELRNFILPSGCRAGAHLHFARAVCRRAERQIVALSRQEPVSNDVRTYLNRLSDLLFVMARYVNHAQGVPEVTLSADR